MALTGLFQMVESMEESSAPQKEGGRKAESETNKQTKKTTQN